ncbi:ferredoxin family protein [Methanogenium sp. MK-MG]|uniref:4Fe-4S dicluster domain-containing protein n=1 Tax=Methanogenium sp. MK-MG TaxID=2599926 RepID=UPI0013EAF0EF|nr:4Fe-4S dicluster domain-containing protein [Methanogenium sp. MK-MG]KAF1073439.1 Electron transport complex subunit RsxB [Methanogenium sp. MK-MG]
MIEIKVDEDACVGCGLCVKDCPMEVFQLQNGVSYPAHPENCMGCLSCHEICPAQALEHKGVVPSRRMYISMKVCNMLRKVI